MISQRRALGALAAASALVTAATAHANPRELPFTYQVETLPKGATEVEQFVDLTPVKAQSALDGTAAWLLASQFQTELEYGLTDRLELGLYMTLVPRPGDQYATSPTLFWGNGLKQRIRYRVSDPTTWPVDVGVYAEIAENEREIELEGKLLIQRRLGPLALIANVTTEREYYFNGEKEWVLAPSGGLTYQLAAFAKLGVEGWMRAEYEDGGSSVRAFNQGPVVYAGPTALFAFGPIWCSSGFYFRADRTDRSTQVGDSYGRFWGRLIVGVGF